MLRKILRNDYFQMLTFLVALAGTVWGAVWTLNTRLEDRLTQLINNLESRVTQRIDRLEDNMNNRFGEIEKRLDSFGERIARNEARLDAQ